MVFVLHGRCRRDMYVFDDVTVHRRVNVEAIACRTGADGASIRDIATGI